MPLLCWEIMKCPASHYLRCEPQKLDKPCWETEAGCFKCDHDCQNCQLYKRARELGYIKDEAAQ